MIVSLQFSKKKTKKNIKINKNIKIEMKNVQIKKYFISQQ